MNQIFFAVMSRIFIISITFFIVLLSSCSNEVKKIDATFDNGNPKEETTYQIVDDKELPTFRTMYYENGSINMAGPLDSNADRHGSWKAYYKTGQLWSEGSFEHGLSTGKIVMYYETGELRAEGEYLKGERTGKWVYYNKSGETLKTEDL